MKVTLLYYTPNAEDILIFTKRTRLLMTPEGLEEIKNWPMEKKLEELHYMSRTVPSSWEMVDVLFLIQDVTRAFTHQLVRTRTASYAQQAQRVVDMSGFGYTVGPSIESRPGAKEVYERVMGDIKEGYHDLMAEGVNAEDARGVLPTNVHTNICAKYNLRAFADLVVKRSDQRVQHEYGQVLQLMLKEVLKVWPWSALFLFPRAKEAFTKLNSYLQEQMNKEVAAGDIMSETEAWAMMKELNLIRSEM